MDIQKIEGTQIADAIDLIWTTSAEDVNCRQG